jgi:hypothetical protein
VTARVLRAPVPPAGKPIYTAGGKIGCSQRYPVEVIEEQWPTAKTEGTGDNVEAGALSDDEVCEGTQYSPR